ncbi:hypothetical protein [Vibrio coralliilyticus]|uniref:Uncharacterized protein n=1 Tax=Vibrio coralliilyticus TaxID=190893 RepID=A0AAP7DEQ6_9VIBR|nr:hypothetical protein [Vibrio coralliilyticus]NOI32023.1 hypothetical protein [Vibrio coralliilyticus]NOJ25224.1 hypothetical protein [Vibrio coralliilyticus]
MTRRKADSSRLGYGIAKSNRGYFVKVPLLKGELSNTFSKIEKARRWQIVHAKNEWGLERFNLIRRGRLAILRKFGSGVTVRPAKSTTKLAAGGVKEYAMFGMFWYDHDGKPKSKMFSHKRHGDNAEVEAHWFAAKQRAVLTASELHLPAHWCPETFDLEHSVQIQQQ